MKPGEETPQSWQQPSQSPPQAPFQVTPAQPPIASSNPIASAGQAPPVAAPPQPIQQPVLTPQPVATVEPALTPLEPVAPIQPSPVLPLESEMSQQVAQDEAYPADEPLGEDGDSAPDTGDDVLLRWQATEYIHHERTVVWYAVLGVVVLAFIALALLVFHSITFAILIPVMLVALVVYVRRPPSVLNYTLSRKGLHVNDHLYTYDQFKAFGVVSHEELHSVVLIPRKRFQVSQTVYFPEEVGEPLVDMLAARLPMQDVHLDTIDRLLKKLRI